MYGIFRKAYHFTDDEIAHNELSGVKTRTIKQEIRIIPSVNYQFAPDWIKDTLLYKLGVKDKMIVEVIPVEENSEDNKPKTPSVPTGAPAGFGAGQQGQETGFKAPQQQSQPITPPIFGGPK